ncbi:maleylacetoacetate isomerase [Oleiagrimonas soli]|uniref:Maleylacetoacetate isomerase n=1 Tax=Oleiagrimonas soli TaxID=1543381 RepID=A0A099CY25_9GAMM|nr:maleylacetoacetate isomerase [Oleiagrimonas soli]KGI78492.1 maleylacetoacetate isomerase [Oleiagrimonas soli]MBB6184258.1 maleylacetoacetate isomerase [Oleiagrimonas soli]
MNNDLTLYGYWRSSAAYRVRIALELKGLSYENRPVHLVRDGGEQHADEYRRINPQELVPTLLHGQRVITQSLAIIEYLDEIWPDGPSLLPAVPRDRAHARAMAFQLACDVHPLGNLRVLQYLERDCAMPQVEREQWMRHWITVGFDALEAMLVQSPNTGTYCMGDTPGLVDICLVPQVYNAHRWKAPMDAYPTIRRIHEACDALPAFRAAAPESQPDAPR